MQSNKQGNRGKPRLFSDLAITTALIILTLLYPHYSCISNASQNGQHQIQNKDQHLAIDVTGLKVYGEGEWKVKQHGTDGKRRVWRKLHLTVDTNTHEIIVAELSLSNASDGEARPNLLRQTRRRINEISGDGAYDTRLCYEAIHIKHAVPLIPPREGSAF